MSAALTPATVAIVGRPNVGKSTLFNRLVGKKLALVDDRPGVTRDRREGEARLGDLVFTVIDTAGLEEADPKSLEGRMRAQTEAAIATADVVLFVVDSRAGVTPTDQAFADIVRRADVPVVLVANKSEGRAGLAGAYDAFSLGLGDPVPISAEHGEGMADLFEALAVYMPDPTVEAEDGEGEADAEEADRAIRVAVVGRPNAGKSTLINTLLGEDRLLTGPEAGITRDSIAVDLEAGGRRFRLFDTAGLRKKARIEDDLEKLSVADTLRAIRFAEVVVVLVDATRPFEDQDLRIADLCAREGRAVVLALSKWDLVAGEPGKLSGLREEATRMLPQLSGCPIIAVSALTEKGLDRLVQAIVDIHTVWNRRVPTNQLNRWLAEATARHAPPAVSGRRLKLKYMTQAKSRPPTFVLFTTRADALPDSYLRYLVNGLREAFEMPGVPVRMILREKENPFVDEGRKGR